MTLLAPLWLAAGLAGALGVLALHFIARMRPAPMLLPTARFVPDLPARAASRAPRPTDLVLLALRAAAAVLLGLAFAGPLVTATRVPVARVVVLDRSAAVANRDSAAALAVSLLRDGDVLVPFDTIADPLPWRDGIEIPAPRQAPADLAAALLVALEQARILARRADSVEMVLVSPVDRAAWSDAVLPVRSAWPGAIRVERVATPAVASPALEVALRGDRDDPLRATLALLGVLSPESRSVRVLRGAPTAADSAWVQDSARVLVLWPRERVADSSGSAAGAVVAGDAVAVAPWSRADVPDGRPTARWADGAPAASEVALGRGCVRHVGVGLPGVGDVALGPSTQELVQALVAPCGVQAHRGPVPDSLVRRLAGSGGRVAGAGIVRAGPSTSPATPWLLGAAIGLLLIEWLVRGRRLPA
jgi:hypothetical protein